MYLWRFFWAYSKLWPIFECFFWPYISHDVRPQSDCSPPLSLARPKRSSLIAYETTSTFRTEPHEAPLLPQWHRRCDSTSPAPSPMTPHVGRATLWPSDSGIVYPDPASAVPLFISIPNGTACGSYKDKDEGMC